MQDQVFVTACHQQGAMMLALLGLFVVALLVQAIAQSRSHQRAQAYRHHVMTARKHRRRASY